MLRCHVNLVCLKYSCLHTCNALYSWQLLESTLAPRKIGKRIKPSNLDFYKQGKPVAQKAQQSPNGIQQSECRSDPFQSMKEDDPQFKASLATIESKWHLVGGACSYLPTDRLSITADEELSSALSSALSNIANFGKQKVESSKIGQVSGKTDSEEVHQADKPVVSSKKDAISPTAHSRVSKALSSSDMLTVVATMATACSAAAESAAVAAKSAAAAAHHAAKAANNSSLAAQASAAAAYNQSYDERVLYGYDDIFPGWQSHVFPDLDKGTDPLDWGFTALEMDSGAGLFMEDLQPNRPTAVGRNRKKRKKVRGKTGSEGSCNGGGKPKGKDKKNELGSVGHIRQSAKVRKRRREKRRQKRRAERQKRNLGKLHSEPPEPVNAVRDEHNGKNQGRANHSSSRAAAEVGRPGDIKGGYLPMPTVLQLRQRPVQQGNINRGVCSSNYRGPPALAELRREIDSSLHKSEALVGTSGRREQPSPSPRVRRMQAHCDQQYFQKQQQDCIRGLQQQQREQWQQQFVQIQPSENVHFKLEQSWRPLPSMNAPNSQLSRFNYG